MSEVQDLVPAGSRWRMSYGGTEFVVLRDCIVGSASAAGKDGRKRSAKQRRSLPGRDHASGRYFFRGRR